MTCQMKTRLNPAHRPPTHIHLHLYRKIYHTPLDILLFCSTLYLVGCMQGTFCLFYFLQLRHKYSKHHIL